MQIRLRELRRLIREALLEAGGAWSSHPVPVSRNYGMNNIVNDREQLTQITARDLDDPDDLSPHLQDAINDDEYDPGPVPPVGANPYLLPDPYVKDSSPLPTPPIKR
jgi:hypothetical protein